MEAENSAAKSKLISLLRKSEKYTKTDMVYLFKGGFWLTVGQTVSTAATFITSVAFANLLDPQIFGVYKYIISIVSLLTITTLAGIDSAVTQAVARGYDGTLMPGVKTKMKWGVIGSLLSISIGAYYLFVGNSVFALSFAVVALFMPFTESFDVYNSLLIGKKLFNAQTVYNSIKKLIALVSIILTVFLTKNIYIILFVYFSSIVLPNLYFLLKTKKIYQQNDNVDPEAILYGKHLSVMYVIGLIVAELDKILVFQYVGAAELAIYSLALAPADQIKGLLKNVNSLALPQFSQKSTLDIKKTIWKKVKLLALGTSLLIALYVLLAPLFFELFFPKYLLSITYSRVIAISLLPVVLAGFLYTILESQKATKELYKYNTHTNIINIIILFPLVYYFGIWGAILTRVISRILIFIYSVHLLKNLDVK